MGTPWVYFDGKDCSGCKHLNERGYCEFTACIIPCTVRATIPEVKPKTNGDNVRAMSDEELAEFFAQQEYRKPVFDGWLPLCNHVMGPRTCHENGCEKCWLDWLKKEAEER